jgi:CRISPR system Cascade subunit CasA
MISWRDGEDNLHRGSLFGAFAALARGEAWSFPALRPHQREPWHAFTVQVAAMALIRAGVATPPETEAAWRDLLLALSGGVPEAWELVVDDWSKPALLQPPMVAAANRADYRSVLPTPDALDMLVTAKAHDVKPERMAAARDEDWLFALVTLQTMEGIMGAGNYGISRMFGGYGHRMTLGIRPAGGAEAAFRRDVHRLVHHARRRQDRRSGLALLWTAAWDGTESLAITELDELYAEICRRVRLCRIKSGIEAKAAGSKCARVSAEAAGGNTGDPWLPLVIDKKVGRATYGRWVAATPTGAGLGYKKMTDLLNREITTPPLLAHVTDEDDGYGLTIVASSLVRGQGKTEGLHRRTIRTTNVRKTGDGDDVDVLDRVGDVAKRRTQEAGEAARLLVQSLNQLFQGGPKTKDVRGDDNSTKAKVEPWRGTFDDEVDARFFNEDFWSEYAGVGGDHRQKWRGWLATLTIKVFEDAYESAPRTEMRRLQAWARARSSLDGKLKSWVGSVSDAVTD